MKIQLISFRGCPNVANARRALRQALASLDLEETFEEVDSAAPDDLRFWGSPTVLVNGVDVAGGRPSGASCRMYPPSEFPGAPPRAMIVARLRGT